ncbi:PqqD family peptide modification chaperone [uncultured Thiodictyon sp.]|uniref:PqqD family peptide modification chaperone n=1 Tax=uncultured Thiodictyon sp. TaxID=1846217 RepID=UPI0025ED9461|nr:PqqD family peptide modification chaperone [uncultured Thiodictyon sp.]
MTTIDPTTPIIRNSDLVAADMDGDLVMMSIEEGEYYGISGVGPRIWELLERPVTVDELAVTICGEFAVDEPTCRSDLLHFTQELIGLGLVQLA